MDIVNDVITSDVPNKEEGTENEMNNQMGEGFEFQSDPFSQPVQPTPSEQINDMNSFPMMNQGPSDLMGGGEYDEEEAKRLEARRQEEEERRKKIEEKMNYELEQKNILREQARGWMDEFEAKRTTNISKRKEQNQINEQEFLNNKKLAKEGHGNSWEIVSSNIALKESDYKGTNDVSRMRAVIIARKNDPSQNKNNSASLI